MKYQWCSDTIILCIVIVILLLWFVVECFNYLWVIEFSCYEISGSMVEDVVITLSFEAFFSTLLDGLFVSSLKMIDGWNLFVKDFEIFGNGLYLEDGMILSFCCKMWCHCLMIKIRNSYLSECHTEFLKN